MSLLKLQQRLTTFASNDIYRYVAIDPGTDTLGLALCEINLRTRVLTVCDVMTLKGSSMITTTPGYVEIHGEKQARLHMLEEALYSVFVHWRPDAVVSEAPFMGRFAAAFGALVECMQSIRNAVRRYRAYMLLETVDPPSAKKSVGVKAKGSSKDDIQKAVIGDVLIVFAEHLSRHGHSEHVYDACAVGKWKFLKFIGAI